MSRVAPLVVGLAVVLPTFYPAAQACGDKFLMAGRGAKFQRAYASVYPGNVLIYTRPSKDPKAAMSDPQFYKALRQAGHTVSVIEDWTLLEQALKTVAVDVVLVDVAEAQRVQPIVATSLAHAEAMYVAFPSSKSITVQKDVPCRLKSSDGTIKYLNELENVLKARSKHAKNS
jgi:hypothetical protein